MITNELARKIVIILEHLSLETIPLIAQAIASGQDVEKICVIYREKAGENREPCSKEICPVCLGVIVGKKGWLVFKHHQNKRQHIAMTVAHHIKNTLNVNTEIKCVHTGIEIYDGCEGEKCEEKTK